MNGSSSRKKSAPEAQAGFWRRLSAHPAFLIAVLVLGVGLMFGAPLLAQHGEDEGAATESHGQAAETHDVAQGAGEHAAADMHEGEPGAEHGEGHGESGTVHPPTLVGVIANIIEARHRQAIILEGSPFIQELGVEPHSPDDYLNPVARQLVIFQAPIFSLLVIIILCTLAIAGARNMTMMPGRMQNLVEMAVEGLDGFVKGIIGPEGARFVPFLGTLFLYIYFQNVFGLIPLMFTPTSVLSTTAAMALVVFLYVQWVGIRSNGILGYLKHMAGDPQDAVGWGMAPLMLPLHIVGELAKPVSLSLRLFGNMMGEETLIAVFMGLGVATLTFTHLPIGIPFHVPFIFLALLTTLIQALVFMLLSTIYFALVLPHHEHEHEDAEHAGALGHQVGGHEAAVDS
jgi:F-type H+-transporting ATPase subunit a